MTEKKDIMLSIIIPVYNEADNIDNLLGELGNCFTGHLNRIEFVFVDDGSKDRSIVVLEEKLQSLSFNAKIVKLSKNYGSHPALRAGIQHASAGNITFLPADLQDPPSLSLTLLDELKKGHDIVWAQRESTQAKWAERTFSAFYARIMRKYAIANYPAKGFDIVIFNEQVKKCLLENPEANSSLFLQILNLGFKQSYISYHKRERKFGVSKWTFKSKIKLFIDSFVSFSYAPIRFVTVIGICLFLLGIAWSVYLILRKLLVNDLESGWPALISILMIGFGITNISLGIIAEYLWRTLDASRKRPIFIVEKIIKFNTHEKP